VWKRDCPRWEQRSGLLDEALSELEWGQTLLDQASQATDKYRDRVDLLSLEVEDLRSELRGQWTFLEVVGLSALVFVSGLAGGVVVGLFAL
jgi:hypothetical protein